MSDSYRTGNLSEKKWASFTLFSRIFRHSDKLFANFPKTSELLATKLVLLGSLIKMLVLLLASLGGPFVAFNPVDCIPTVVAGMRLMSSLLLLVICFCYRTIRILNIGLAN
jgi:hypothetical protein